jgi:hypothetical protein
VLRSIHSLVFHGKGHATSLRHALSTNFLARWQQNLSMRCQWHADVASGQCLVPFHSRVPVWCQCSTAATSWHRRCVHGPHAVGVPSYWHIASARQPNQRGSCWRACRGNSVCYVVFWGWQMVRPLPSSVSAQGNSMWSQSNTVRQRLSCGKPGRLLLPSLAVWQVLVCGGVPYLHMRVAELSHILQLQGPTSRS